MKIFHLEFAKTGLWMSGGEKCMVELIKYFSSENIQNVILTTDNGKTVYEKLGLIESKNLKYIIIDSFWTEEKYHVFISYILRLFLFKKIKKQIIENVNSKEDVLMCHSDFFPNTIPAKIISKYFNKKVLYWLHAISPDIFKGYTGQYTGRFSVPKLNIVHNKLNQILFFIFSKKGIILTVNSYYKKILNKDNIVVIEKFGGLDIGVSNQYTLKIEKDYDMVFMGRFQEPKGISEIAEIFYNLKRIKGDSRLLIIGDGDMKLKKDLFLKMQEYKISDAVNYVGFISDKELKDKYLSSSKVFIFPSYCESYGLVVLEAMAMGLPVVAYDLPVYDAFNGYITKVPILDNKKFSIEIYNLVTDTEKYISKSEDVKRFASNFSWSKTGKEVLSIINSL